MENHPISQGTDDKKSRKMSHIINERSFKKNKINPKTIDEIFEEKDDGILAPKMDSIHSESFADNLRLSIELDPYEDIKLDLQLQSIIPLQLSPDE